MSAGNRYRARCARWGRKKTHWMVREKGSTGSIVRHLWGGGTDIQWPRIYLEVPVLRMPDVFLELAEEARNSELVDDQSTDMKDVQPQRTGQARPVLVTEMMNSTPVLGSRAFRVTNTSAEMIPDINLDEPVNRSGQLSDTEQPITLGVMTDKGANGPSGPTQWNGTVCLTQIRCRPGGAHSH